MSMSIGSNGGSKAEINITPMIDVLLVLIIIFMVITPLAPHGLRTLVPQPPQPDGGPAAPSHDIVVTVQGDGSVLLNQEPIGLDALGARLFTLFKNGAANVVFVRGDKSLSFAQVAAVLDIARGAGVSRVALMTT